MGGGMGAGAGVGIGVGMRGDDDSAAGALRQLCERLLASLLFYQVRESVCGYQAYTIQTPHSQINTQRVLNTLNN